MAPFYFTVRDMWLVCCNTADVVLTCRMAEPAAPPGSSGPPEDSATLNAIGEQPATQAGPAADTVMLDAVEQEPAQPAEAGTVAETAQDGTAQDGTAQAGTVAETAPASEPQEVAYRPVEKSTGTNRKKSLREINGSPAATTPKPKARTSSTGANDTEAQLAKLKQFFHDKYNSDYDFSDWTCTVRSLSASVPSSVCVCRRWYARSV